MADHLSRRRGYKRSDVTRTIELATKNLLTATQQDKQTLMARLDVLRTDLRELDTQIFDKMSTDGATEDVMSAEYTKSVRYEENILSALFMLQANSRIKGPVFGGKDFSGEASGGSSSRTADDRSIPAYKVKIPEIPLPTYTHRKGEDLTKFFSNFEQIVNKYNLSEFEKFIYLKNQVSNEPAIILESLDAANQTYDGAKSLLEEAFASPVTRKFNAISSLTQLKLRNNDDPYRYIASMRQVTQMVRSLNVTIDDVMQYFVWESLNGTMQTQLVGITNKNKPTLAEITTNIFMAAERYKGVLAETSTQSMKMEPKRKSQHEQETLVTAVAVKEKTSSKPSKKFCSLCSTKDKLMNSHSTYECQVYPTAEDKISRLKESNGCFKCGNTNHVTAQCRYRFNHKCRLCSRYHFSYLCTKKETELNSNSLFVGNAALEQYGEDCIIPTFTVNIQSQKLRVMRDSGCQPNFVTQNMADKLKLKIISKNCPLTIKGFNADDKILTNIVSIKLMKNHPPITAICIPEIKVKISVPNINKVVNSFVDKGYKLADDYLYNAEESIGNFDFLLGNNDAQILLHTEKSFGSKPQSMYAETSLGVVLYGSVKRMIDNIKYLPAVGKSKNRSKKHNVNVQAVKMESNGGKMTRDFGDFFAFKVSIDASNAISEDSLDQAVDDIIKYQTPNMIYDSENYPDDDVENTRLSKYALESATRDEDGRLILPLLWNEKVYHNLGTNYDLSKAVLHSNLKRLKASNEKLSLYDTAIKDHLNAGVIEEIHDLPNYIKEHPNVSFIPHMPVYRMDKDSTKCRVVLLSNLVQNDCGKSISHNQAMVSGANLNSKISSAITKLRFDKYLVVFDIVKAFLNIGLKLSDQDKLVILWYKEVGDNKNKLVAYKYTKLPFGLRCSPNILMIALYKILVEDSPDNDEFKYLKQLIYDLTYMDNCAITSNDSNELKYHCEKLKDIFAPYHFKLQQFASNHQELNADISETPSLTTTKLLGMQYDLVDDTLSTNPIVLEKTANTKRKILSSIAKNYDVLQINGPLLNRARIFMHTLQCQKGLGWDEKISNDQKKQWDNICNQTNKSPSLQISRSFGGRDDSYELIAFTDASKLMIGTVLYLKNLKTNQVNFLSARNIIVSNILEGKTIPALELHAISHGGQHMVETLKELNGEKTVIPINIVKLRLYSDSMVALAWVYGYCIKLDKMQKVKPFVKNRLKRIDKICEISPIEFNFIAGGDNPSDMITRPISYKTLCKTSYISGPQFLSEDNQDKSTDDFGFIVPDEKFKISNDESLIGANAATVSETLNRKHVVDLDKYSTLHKFVRVHRLVNIFINKLKYRVKCRNNESCVKTNPTHVAYVNLIKTEQCLYFADIIKFFSSKNVPSINVPPLINKFNLFLDSEGLIRVKGKFVEWKLNACGMFPILLPQKSTLTKLIIQDVHERFSHVGAYTVMAQIRHNYFIPKIYSVVKGTLSECLVCKRVNARTVKTNQSMYRNFRANPSEVPYRYSYIDHFGPYLTDVQGKRKKVWILLITCLWSRSINLKIVYDMTVSEFLRALQLHIFDYGIPEKIFSDLGSQLVAGSNIISELIKQPSCIEFFESFRMKPTEFVQYFKGNHDLGALVESCVKISKRLINGSIRNSILKLHEFEFIVYQTIHLANKRPIAFEEHLRNVNNITEIPTPITPEILLKGFESPSINILPEEELDGDLKEWNSKEGNLKSIKICSSKLQKAREKLKQIYHEEFLTSLLSQAVCKKDLYKAVTHKIVRTGDIVLLKEENMKSSKFPMGRIVKTIANDLNEVTGVIVKKGNGETVKRSINVIIPYMSLNESTMYVDEGISTNNNTDDDIEIAVRKKRKAATRSKNKTERLYYNGMA